jgi:phosphoserine aminotransferase
MIPMTLLSPGRTADYVVSGYWSQKAVEAARFHGDVRVAWDGADGGFNALPGPGEPLGRDDSAYLHYVSNETAEGLQFRWLPRTQAPLACDMSSDFLSRPMDLSPFALVYAHAQKNFGTAGVTIVLVRDDVVERSRAARLPPILSYAAHADARSILHTPPVFAIYVVLLMLRWLMDDVGGLEAMGRLSAEKARVVRGALAENRHFYREDARPGFASEMNIAFRCPSPALDARFVERAESAGLIGTEGHRSRGGLRISLYNGVTLDDARAAAELLREFAREASRE